MLPDIFFVGGVESLSLTRAEFALDLSDRTKATAAILHKKPTGLRFRPQEVSFPVTYRQQNGLACLPYIRNDTRLKIVIAWLFYLILGGNIKKFSCSARDIIDSSNY